MNATTATPKGCTNFKTRQLARLLSRHYDQELAKAGIKTTQYSLLSHVLHQGPVAPGELARRMGLDASTLTRNLQPLLAAGWLVQAAGADARSRLISGKIGRPITFHQSPSMASISHAPRRSTW